MFCCCEGGCGGSANGASGDRTATLASIGLHTVGFIGLASFTIYKYPVSAKHLALIIALELLLVIAFSIITAVRPKKGFPNFERNKLNNTLEKRQFAVILFISLINGIVLISFRFAGDILCVDLSPDAADVSCAYASTLVVLYWFKPIFAIIGLAITFGNAQRKIQALRERQQGQRTFQLRDIPGPYMHHGQYVPEGNLTYPPSTHYWPGRPAKVATNAQARSERWHDVKL